MDSDFLIRSGSNDDQLTWMDVRYKDILPTPRHGKPVEINAMWYNALCIASYFSKMFNIDDMYDVLSIKVKKSFNEKFVIDGMLKDVISGGECDMQNRLNQVWATSLPFIPIDNKICIEVLNNIYANLYTTHGLRTLDPKDPQFKATYKGSHYSRDIVYHQGTVWTFPLGSFYIGYLMNENYSEEAKAFVNSKLQVFDSILNEGCLGQVAEIYDGLIPLNSKGCYAQAWSVTEILRVYKHINKTGENETRNAKSCYATV